MRESAKVENTKTTKRSDSANKTNLNKGKDSSSCGSCRACKSLSSPRLSPESASSALSHAKTIGKESCAASFMQRNYGNNFTASVLSRPSAVGGQGTAISHKPSAISRKCSCGGSCSKCKGEEEADRISMSIMKMSKPSAISYQPSANNNEQGLINEIISNKGSGQRLDDSTSSFMKDRFGYDFGRVRLHTDSYAARKSNELNAEAFTIGRDVFFNAGRYNPSTIEGKRLLGHELTHVVQQSRQITEGNESRFVQRYPANTPHGQPYTAGAMHNHLPSGRWRDIQSASSCLRGVVECMCVTAHPRGVLMLAYLHEMSDYPLAQSHLVHYVHRGGGADYMENVSNFITRESGVRGKLSGFVSISSAGRGHFKVEQSDYATDTTGQDFRYAFGAIDRLDYEVDIKAGIVHIWFADRYEFHPVYPGIYTAMSGDVVRPTNCVHAAAVELKSSGAADFWMVGYGTVPISIVTGSGSSGGGGTL